MQKVEELQFDTALGCQQTSDPGQVLRRVSSGLLTVLLSTLLAACGPAINQTPPPPFEDYASWHTIDFSEGLLHYASAGQPGNPLVIFVHGTPGSWSAFREYLQNQELAQRTHMIALDRPGFGKSAPLGTTPEFKDQAAAVARLMRLNQSDRKAIVVGHSLGGSISYRVAIDYPDLVGGVLAISSAIDPELSNPRWYNYAAGLPLVRWLLPDDLTTSNQEMMPLTDQLDAMLAKLAQVTMPVTVIQGANDGLVNHKNADFAEQTLINADLKVSRYADRGHFIVWEEHEAMVEEILHLVAKAEPLQLDVVRQKELTKTTISYRSEL